MTWVKVDDRYDDTPKIRSAFRENPIFVALHIMATTYSARHETDGVIDLEWITDRVPAKRTRDSVIATMVDRRILDPVDDTHWQVHDFLEYNPSHDDLVRKRAADVARKVSARNPTGHSADVQPESERNPDGIQAASRAGAPHALPVPSRPVPTRPTPTNKDSLRSPKDDREDVEKLCQLLSDLTRKRTDTPSSSTKYRVTAGWRKEMRLLIDRDGRTPEQIERVVRWVDGDEFWSRNVLSPSKLRAQYDRLVLAAKDGPSKAALAAQRAPALERMDQWQRPSGEGS